MPNQIDITAMTSTELKRLKAKQLDEQWKIKHPDGLYYIIGVASFNVRMPQEWNVGKLIDRPTAAYHHHANKYCGPYTGSGFHNVRKHYTFKTKETFLAKAKELNITNPFIIDLLRQNNEENQ